MNVVFQFREWATKRNFKRQNRLRNDELWDVEDGSDIMGLGRLFLHIELGYCNNRTSVLFEGFSTACVVYIGGYKIMHINYNF